MNIETALKEYLKNGFSVFPTEDKNPAINSWTDLQNTQLTEEELEKLYKKQTIRTHLEKPIYLQKGKTINGLALVCGKVSGSLEVIDVDCKYDLTGSLWEDLSETLKIELPEIYNKLVIAETKSKGYHIYYRHDVNIISGNLKFAERKATTEEVKKGEKTKVLIETRGQGGYVIAEPSPGYKFIQNNIYNIPTITSEQRIKIIEICRDFNQIEEKPKEEKRSNYTQSFKRLGLNPFEDYNERGDVITLLQGHGWSIFRETAQRVYLTRPGGGTNSDYSANYLKSKKLFSNWSASVYDFEIKKAYNNSQVFSILECGGDLKLTYRRLLELGYGEPEPGVQIKPTQIKLINVQVDLQPPTSTEDFITALKYSPGDTLKIENVIYQNTNIIINSPGVEAETEVLKVIELLQGGEKDVRIYINENGEEYREYNYILKHIWNKYSTEELTDRKKDEFLDEIIYSALKIKPLYRDIFIKNFFNQEPTEKLGITIEGLMDIIEKTSTKKTKEQKNKEIKKLISELSELQERGEIDKAISKAQENLKIIETIGDENLISSFTYYENIIDQIKKTPFALETGYKDLDKYIGFSPGAITLIAGRPGHGKTTFMLNLLSKMIYNTEDSSIIFFTYEEPLKNIFLKLLNILIDNDFSNDINYLQTRYNVKLAKASNYEFLKHYIKDQMLTIQRIEEGLRMLSALIDSEKIIIIDKSYSIEDLGKIITELNKTKKIHAVFIDYIQRINTNKKTQDKRTEIAHISDQILQTAKNTGLPIILGAQLNREAKDSPQLNNLKEAGNLEEDANCVISVFSPDKEEEDKDKEVTPQRNVDLEIKVLKNREGENNVKIKLEWDRNTGAISNPTNGINTIDDLYYH